MITSKGAEEAASLVSAISVSLCLLILIIAGIFSWLRKRISADWWRDKCGCFGGDGEGSFSGISNAFPPKRPPDTTNNFDAIPRTEAAGIDNPSFQRADHTEKQIHGLTGQNEAFVVIPRISIRRAPPDYNSLESASQYRLSGPEGENSSELLNSLRPRTNTNDSRRMAKVFSKPSITSDYVSDVDSDYYLPVTRKPTGGRCSSRTIGEKKKHRRKHQHKHATRASHGREHKYAATLTNLSKADLRKPICRRHSLATETQESSRSHVERLRPVPPARTKRKRSSSDAHLRTTTWKSPAQNQSSHIGEGPKNASIRLGGSFHLAGTTNDGGAQTLTVEHALKKASSLNPLPAKTAGLVRSETILEVPIYRKSERSASARTDDKKSPGKNQQVGARPKTRQKPPRPHAARDRKRDRRSDVVSRREKWQWGYGSLPADFGKIQSSALEQIGMTPESLVDSIEHLDFEKLCRPVPTITDDQRLATPRKPVINELMPGDEKEILKNTYEFEEIGIVTDL